MTSRKIVHAQTVLFQDDIDELKELTGQNSTKDALAVAVEYYLVSAKLGAKIGAT